MRSVYSFNSLHTHSVSDSSSMYTDPTRIALYQHPSPPLSQCGESLVIIALVTPLSLPHPLHVAVWEISDPTGTAFSWLGDASLANGYIPTPSPTTVYRCVQ